MHSPPVCAQPSSPLNTTFTDEGEASTSTPSSSRGKIGGRGRGRGRGGRGAAATPRNLAAGPTPQSQQVLEHVEAVTLLASQLVGSVRLQPSYVLPYLKVILASLRMEGIPQVQVHAAATVLAAFSSNAGTPERQQDVVAQFLSEFLHCVTTGVHPRRTFLADAEANVSVHLVVALLTQLVQVRVQGCGKCWFSLDGVLATMFAHFQLVTFVHVFLLLSTISMHHHCAFPSCSPLPLILFPSASQCSATLPGHDEPPEAIPTCFKPVFHWADTFWAAMLDAVPQSKAAKSDAELDVKALLEVVVAGQ